MSKEDAEKVIKEYSAKVNEELAKIADEDLRKELEENLIKAQATFERRLQKIEDSVEPEKRTQQVRILVANFNHEIRKIAADGDIEQDIEASFEKVQKVVDRKINEITDATHQAVQQQKEKGSRMGDIGESLLYSISSLAGVDIGPIGDIIDVARDAGDAYDELTDSVDANRVSNEKNKRAVIGVWGARKEELATLKETGQSQNYLVASLNVLGAAYENIFIWLSKKVGLDKLYVKLGWMKAQATTANTTAETANTVAVTGNTLAQKSKISFNQT